MQKAKRCLVAPLETREGFIHSSFAHSCNLRFGGRLLTALEGGERLPDCMLLPAGQLQTLVRHPNGFPVFMEDDRLCCGGESIPAEDETWNGAIQTGPLYAQAIIEACNALRLPEIALPPQAVQALRQTADALQNGQGQNAQALCMRLVGLGRGLTPSADDALVGMLAAFRRAGNQTAFLTPALLERTTTVSEKYLKCAHEGFFSQRVLSIFDARQNVEDLTAAMKKAADWGASSGRDMLWGLRAACERFPPGL